LETTRFNPRAAFRETKHLRDSIDIISVLVMTMLTLSAIMVIRRPPDCVLGFGVIELWAAMVFTFNLNSVSVAAV